MNYFELYPGDYLRDTTHLSLAEHGAYLLLMITYYANEKPLPSDAKKLYRMVGAISRSERESVLLVADLYFPVSENGMRINARAEREIDKAKVRISNSKKNGKLGGRPIKVTQWDTQQDAGGVPTDNPAETHSGKALHMPHATCHKDQEHNPNGLFVDLPINGSQSVEIIKPKRSICPINEIVNLYHETLPAHPGCEKMTAKRRSYIRTRWSEDLPSIEAWRNFFQDVSNSKFLTGRTDPAPGHKRFIASLDWLTKADNFAKVCEGNYHR